MAIGTDDVIEKFADTPTLLTSSTGSLAADGFVAVDGGNWTNSDDVPFAAFVLEVAWGTIPAAGRTVDLYGMPHDIQSTNEPRVPSLTYQHYFMGAFPLDTAASVSTAYRTFLPLVFLPNIKSGQPILFYIHNNTAQTLSAGWQLWITPKTQGPKA